MLLRLRLLARPAADRREAGVAVGDEGAHVQLFGQRHGLPVVLLCLRDPGPIGIGSGLPEQSKGDCFVPALPPLAGNRQGVLVERVGLIGPTVE